MPIVSRTLTKLANRDDIEPGMKRWRVDGIDARDRDWVHGPFFALEGTPAEAIRDAAWTTQQLQDVDLSEVIEWVELKNTVASFDFTNRDITEEQAEDHIATEFASRLGDAAIRLAWWIESLGPPSWTAIANRIGWTSQQRSDVQDRGIALEAAEASYDQVL